MLKFEPCRLSEACAPVSAIIACYECAETIERAVRSIAMQTLRPAEIIVVDDASGAQTRAVLKKLEERYAGWLRLFLLPENRGVASARNAGWEAATQPYIAFLDADDAWHPRKIEIQYDYMRLHPEVALSGHRHRVLEVERHVSWGINETNAVAINKWRMMLSNQFVTPSVMLKRELPFRFLEGRRYMEDHLLWMEILCNGRQVVRLEQELAAIFKRSYGEAGLSANLWQMELSDLRNYRMLAQQRCLTLLPWVFFSVFSVLKFWRRLLIVLLLRLGGRLHARNAFTQPQVLNPQPCIDCPPGKRVAIVMATYNGARHIDEQIRSIQAQTFRDWVLYVRDDGSHDETINKIDEYALTDSRIQRVTRDAPRRGAIGNFSALMEVALEQHADYIFLSDQDDVWHPEKLAILYGAMKELESDYGERTPLLAHSDLEVVSEKMQTISPSFARYIGLYPREGGLGVLLCQNQVTGCACVVNRALLEIATPVPQSVLMHDWWMALLAASTGKIGFVDRALIKYRQHSSNVIGAEPYFRRLRNLLFSAERWNIHLKTVRQSIEQASNLAERLSARKVRVPRSAFEQIVVYGGILGVNSLLRVKRLWSHKIYKQAVLSNMLFRAVIAAMGRKARDE